MEFSLSDTINQKILEVSNKNYWLVRTYSGEYYDIFRDHGFIGIGWNEIKLLDIKNIPVETSAKGEKREKGLREKKKEIVETLANKVIFSDDKEFASADSQLSAGVRAIHQILIFVREIKKGDIVLIPSSSSDFYCFGEIEETPVHLADSLERLNTNCELIKRKRVRWIKKDVPRHRLDPNYLRFLRVQSTITNLSEYTYYIEKTISNSFVLDGLSHFVFKVTRSEDVNPKHYKALLKAIELTEQLILEETGDSIGEVDIKARVQSPGEFVIVSNYLPYVYYFAITIVLVLGGGLAIDKIGLKLGTKGILGGILQAKNNKTNRAEYEKNQEQKRKIQETVRIALELNPELIKDCENVVIKLIDNDSPKGLPPTPGDNEIAQR